MANLDVPTDLALDEKLEIDRGAGQFGYFPMLAESLANSLDAMDKGDLAAKAAKAVA